MHCERVLARGSFRELLKKLSSKIVEYIASGILPFFYSSLLLLPSGKLHHAI
jgi:hypothetical protein